MSYRTFPPSLAERIGLSKKTFVIVHQFQPPASSEPIWYDRWGGPQLSFLIDGLEGFEVEYKLVDVETALVSSKTVFSDVDYAISLVCGNLNIALWAAIPAVAEWYGAVAVPTSADTAIVGERKDVANLVAARVGLPVPTWSYPFETPPAASGEYWLSKPRDYGNSYGVKIYTIEVLQNQEIPIFIYIKNSSMDMIARLAYFGISKNVNTSFCIRES